MLCGAEHNWLLPCRPHPPTPEVAPREAPLPSHFTAARLERLITAFASRLGQPSDAVPSTRCMSYYSIKRLLADIRTHAPELKWLRAIPYPRQITSLTQAGIITLVPVEGTIAPRDQLFAIGLGVSPERMDPLELITAVEPDGVICYLSAIALHGLTTQIPTHHHVARLVAKAPERRPEIAPDMPMSTAAPKLGTLRCTIRGVQYYSTLRPRAKVPGILRKQMSDTFLARCTSVAQTLLDTLVRPISCGGPAVVFEAWERAAPQLGGAHLDELVEYLDHPFLARRVGYMLEHVGAEKLHLRNPITDSSGPAAPLLPGMPYTRIDTRWNLLVP